MKARLASSCVAWLWLTACSAEQATASDETGSESESETGELFETECEVVWEWRLDVTPETVTWPAPSYLRLEVDAEGNVYGVSWIDQGPEAEAWIAKWNVDGTQAWTRTLGEPMAPDGGNAIEVGPNGELFVLGTTFLPDFEQTSWFAKVDATSGDTLWSIPGPTMWGEDIARADGHLLLLGNHHDHDTGTTTQILSARSPVDGSELWTREGPTEVGYEIVVDRMTRLAVSDTGDIYMAGTFGFTEWQGDFSPQTGTLLLIYDANGQLIASRDRDTWQSIVLVDGSPDVYYETYDSHADLQSRYGLESLMGTWALRWRIEQEMWTVGPGLRRARVLGASDDTLYVGGGVDDYPEGGEPLWTATVDRYTGALTRGCTHGLDAQGHASKWQGFGYGVGHPQGGFVAWGTEDDEFNDQSWTLWLRHFSL